MRRAIVEPFEQVYRSSDGSALAVKTRVTFLEFVEITTADGLTLPGADLDDMGEPLLAGPILRISHAIADDDGHGLFTTILLGS